MTHLFAMKEDLEQIAFLKAWPAQHAQETALASDYRSLRSNVKDQLCSSLQAASSTAVCDPMQRAVSQHTIPLLEAIEKQVDKVGEGLALTLGPCYALHNPTPASQRKANELFGLPELTEIIASYLDPHEILVLMQVNRVIYAAIDGSPALQRYMGLRPDPGVYFHTHLGDASFSPFPPIRCDAEGEYERYADAEDGMAQGQYCVNLTLGYYGKAGHLPEADSRCRAMLICQPPVYDTGVETGCCGQMECYEATRGWSPTNLHSETGITVGQILDKAAELLEKHQRCPYAEPRSHDADGEVIVSPVFTGVAHDVPSDDPVMEGFWALKRRGKQMRRRDASCNKKFGVYTDAKLRAHEAGQPIPTFEEFGGGSRRSSWSTVDSDSSASDDSESSDNSESRDNAESSSNLESSDQSESSDDSE
ncbi:hypothetical protein B0A55_00516 [Friedmanniomyces simplex]|uniref:F-box domain-containing protein n=1 Tax=Friedmanniomyces simplex TaxID=329884 RepID=A0A4U0Y4S8_9PEZI|nr:hypothetical protein B0A55_00516 [Friedmanniomyces simplex]